VTEGSQPPAGVDTTVPTAARMYDYWLGGHENFAADRAAALKITEGTPGVPEAARANRRFLGRAVRYLAREAGIRQFLDLGAGLPTNGNVHQVALEVTPDARVVYVDNDPMVIAHARALDPGDTRPGSSAASPASRPDPVAARGGSRLRKRADRPRAAGR